MLRRSMGTTAKNMYEYQNARAELVRYIKPS
ncbi:hypothetical protein EhV18_00202 [Emiliania huxleyi virus 18]|nr:hypothetical protein EhV18_00202 [Emiliania huxleyi virus 18]